MNIAVFVSGRGSNLRAVQDGIDRGDIDAKVVLVISSRDDAAALAWAGERNIATMSLQGVPADEHAARLLPRLRAAAVDLVVLAGYLRHIPREIVHTYRNRMINVHPALLPSFGGAGMYGHHVHEAVLAAGARVSGATVHIVDEEYDRGPILLQRCVPVRSDDTAETLAARVLEVEHLLLPQAVRLLSLERIQFEAGRVIINEET